MFTDNPVLDFARHDARQQDELKRLPVCGWCDEPIQQEFAVYINDEYICDDCLDGLKVEVFPIW